jgi:PAS domain S-box-containing protein
MKIRNFKILIPVVLALLIGGNYLFISISYKSQLKYNQDLLTKQAEIFTSSVEKSCLDFENDINYILYSDDLIKIFKPDQNADVLVKLKVFYSKYSSLVTNIYVYDQHLNVFSLYRDKKENFLTDIYQSRKQNDLYAKDQIIISENQHLFVTPIFRDNELIGNIIVSVDLINYFKTIFSPIHVGVPIWFTVLNQNGSIFFATINNYSYKESDLTTVNADLQSNKEGCIIAKINIDLKSLKYLIIYYPFTIFNEKLGILYNYNFEGIKYQMFPIGMLVILFNLIIILVIILYYFKLVQNKDEEENKLRESEEAFKQIIELMPIGIIIINRENKIQSINRAAKKMLLVDKNEDLLGVDISHRFFMGKALLLDDEFASAYETDHFLHYEKEGKELVIYKKDIPLTLKGEELIVQSFIDVTPIEQSRKREISANMAKSEFLAKMSHEIRTPMNGIIGMADALSQQLLTEEQKDQVGIIKKSADLLLSILNDILDISKIEAGKMVLEEIPFKIKEEVHLATDLFKVSADEKKINLHAVFEEGLTEKMIGDPFRLRQILINLIGNALKFTQEGEIRIKVKEIEKYNRNLVIQFAVEDTGIGIPKDKIQNIFQSFSQADNSTTRKYGGTGLGTAISKQLVELMNGEIKVESPSSLTTNPKYPGCRFTFTIELFSNETIVKDLNNNNVTSFSQIKTLIIGENKSDEKQIEESLSYFNVPVEQHVYQKATVDFLKSNSQNNEDEKYKLLIVKDAPTFDGFKFIARMNDAKIVSYFNILMISTNDRTGNYVKCRRSGVDHYLIQPFETSEIYNFLCETFTGLHIEEEKSKFKLHKLKTDLNILVAEDNAINQKVAKTLFKNIGYEVDFAKNGIETLEMVRRKAYDIIFMDIMMPEMDGIQATIELRKLGSSIPIIAMTANISKDEKSNALMSGMNDYVTKPVRIDTVKKILIKLFSEEVGIDIL